MIKQVGTPPDPAPGATEETVVERSESTGSGGAEGAGSGAPAVPPVVVVADSEVSEKARRRRFSAEYKLRVLQEADACSEPGEIGALLRREGLYSSHLGVWRRQRDEGTLQGLSPRKRGRKAKPKNPLLKKVAELERENARLKSRLMQAETIIDVQKKVSQILGIPLNDEPNGKNE
jgi:transposase-like protein